MQRAATLRSACSAAAPRAFSTKAAAAAARMQPLLLDPRERPASLLDIPDYKRAARKWSKGTVVSDAMDKSVVVLLERWAQNWDKTRVKKRTKYVCHDEANVCRVGDRVYFSQTRPLSKTKHSVVQFNAGNPHHLRDFAEGRGPRCVAALEVFEALEGAAADAVPRAAWAAALRERGLLESDEAAAAMAQGEPADVSRARATQLFLAADADQTRSLLAELSAAGTDSTAALQ